MPDHHPGSEVHHGARRVVEHPLLGPLPDAASITFTLDGRPCSGRAGEPILAALLADGIRVCRTMPRTGEARGGFCLVGRCSDCLMVVDGVPNVRTCLTSLAVGMRIETQRGQGDRERAPANAGDPE